jgi:hypothetical protein
MHADLQRMVNDLTEFVGLGIELTDMRLNSVVFGPHSGEIDWLRRESLLLRRTPPQARAELERTGFLTSTGPHRIPADPALGMMSRMVVPTRWHGVTYGFLWLLDDRYALTPSQLAHVVGVAADIGRILYCAQRAREVDANRLSNLLSAPLEIRQRAAAELLESGSISRTSPVAVVVLQQQAQDDPSDELAAALWDMGADILPRAALSVVEQQHTVMLIPLPRSGDLGPARSAAARLRRLYLSSWSPRLTSVVAGISDPHPELVDANAAFRQAILAAQVAAALPELGPVVEWGRMGVFRALVNIPSDQLGCLVRDSCVRSIMDAGDPTLLPTLEAYLDSGCDVRGTSAFLNVHRGTVYYRLHKVESVCGLSLRDGLDRLTLHLSIKLGRLAGVIPGPARVEPLAYGRNP